jgi:hypothetical protein
MQLADSDVYSQNPAYRLLPLASPPLANVRHIEVGRGNASIRFVQMYVWGNPPRATGRWTDRGASMVSTGK